MRLFSPLTSPTRKITVAGLIGFAFIAQLAGVYYLWSHTSSSGEFLGRYSYRYAIGLFANVILVMAWAFILLQHKRIVIWLENLRVIERMRIIILPGIAVFILWLFPVEAPIKQYFALNWLLITAVTVYTMPDRETHYRWGWVMIAVLALLFIPTLITTLTNRYFSQDEAMWADYATSPFEAGGLYARTWQEQPFTIAPGRSWSTVVLGWMLENVDYDIKVGRLLNFYFWITGFIGVGAVTWRLYGRQAAVVSTTFAALGLSFIPFVDYRPDHQLPAVAMFIMFTALQARYTTGKRGFWDFACGLAGTLSLHFHAAGIVFAFGFSVYYLAEYIGTSARSRRLANIRPLLWYGAGALLGCVIYYVLDIATIGGLQVYLDFLIKHRYSARRILRFLSWPSPLFERAIVVTSFLYIAWRRTEADRMVIGMILCVILGILALDTQGYRTTFSAFYVIPVGALIADALRDPRIPAARSLRRAVLALALFIMLAGQWMGEFIAWPAVQYVAQTGELPPFLYEELKPKLLPLLRDDDVVASTHQLIWTIPHKPTLYFVGSEATAQETYHLTDREQVWERVKPTVIVNVENQMVIEKGLQAYIDNHHFVVCDEMTVTGVNITVMRETCPPPTNP